MRPTRRAASGTVNTVVTAKPTPSQRDRRTVTGEPMPNAALYLLASADGLEPLAPLELAAPALLWSEVTSVLNEMRWRGELSEALAEAAFERLLVAPIARRADAAHYSQAREVARELGWAKTYDAEYVSLAHMLDATLLSRDERLRRGAGRLVTVAGPDEVFDRLSAGD